MSHAMLYIGFALVIAVVLSVGAVLWRHTESQFLDLMIQVGKMGKDITTLKVQGDRNEAAIRNLQDEMKEVRQDIKWLKRSQGAGEGIMRVPRRRKANE